MLLRLKYLVIVIVALFATVSPVNSVTLTVTRPMRMVFTPASFRPLDAVWLDVNKDGVFSSVERVTDPDGTGIILQTPDGKSAGKRGPPLEKNRYCQFVLRY